MVPGPRAADRLQMTRTAGNEAAGDLDKRSTFCFGGAGHT